MVDLSKIRQACIEAIAKGKETVDLEDGTTIKISSINASGIVEHTGVSEQGFIKKPQS